MNGPDLYDIAIVGLAGRFPGAADARELWRNLEAGVESILPLLEEDLAAAGVPRELRDDPSYVKAAAWLEGADLFDAGLFGMTPREAEILDPQHRLFLECAWEALEDAGCDPQSFAGTIGVYAGTFLSTYLINNLLPNRHLLHAVGELAVRHGNEKDYLATLTSYKLNLRGPSVSVQTACSTSLVAVHLACQALLNRECDAALAGGATLRVPQKAGYLHQPGGILSPDGHCRAFDASAQGTVFGHGVGIVVLKRLADALDGGDRIYAVIKGTAVNNDGAGKVGFTAPGVDGQAAVIAEALAVAGIPPETVSYVEAHGTGTALGDPVEIAALTQAFRQGTDARSFCAIGSIKTNIGHMGTAAGIAGLIKLALMLHHRRIPPSLHFAQPNPQIDFASSPFYVNTKARDWPAGGAPRRGGISSFGMGGTNAHALLEEVPALPAVGPAREWHLLPLSAASDTALASAASRLAAHLATSPGLDPADVAFTLQTGRRALPFRRAWTYRDLEGAAAALADPLLHAVAASAGPVEDGRPVAFLFPGQGAQYPGMARGLYETEERFREHIDQACDALYPILGLDLRRLLLSEEDGETGTLLERTELAQPALFAVEHALARLLMGWGVFPRAMAGHSLGEYVAACLAGVFSFEDALELVAERGRLMQALPPGAMVAVPLPEEEVVARLAGGLSLAAVNTPSLCTVSGPREEVEAWAAGLAEAGVQVRPLRTSHAFHSAMMDPVIEPFASRVRQVRSAPPEIPFLSNLTGGWFGSGEAPGPESWARHLRSPVRFADNARELLQDPDLILLEVGPGRTLASLVARQPGAAARTILSAGRHPRDPEPAEVSLLRALGRLWTAGVRVDWAAYHSGRSRRRVFLPAYPFERKRYWIDPNPERELPVVGADRRAALEDWFYRPVWKQGRPLQVAATDGAGASPWLVFCDAAGLGDAVADLLEVGGHRAIRVRTGASFSRSDDGAYRLNPGRPEDFRELLRDLAARGTMPATVAHLWAVTPEGTVAEALPDLSFHSLVFLARALGAEHWSAPLRLGVVANGLNVVTGEERLQPEKALLLGPFRVIPQEYPNVRGVVVDVHLGAHLRDLPGRVAAEIRSGTDGSCVALRGPFRWVQEHERVRLEGLPGWRLRDGGVYLITGGLGGLGLAMAEHLALSRGARLVLLGRSSLPERRQWESWLEARDADDPVSRRIAALLRLERMGSEVLPVSADVADPVQVRAAVEQARSRFGEIHGVIHAAGVPGAGTIQLRTREAAEGVLAPKVRGTLALAEALSGEPLDFMVLFSSTTAVAGGFGSVDYCAANAFLDAFAESGWLGPATFLCSIAWGTWREIGMAAAGAHVAGAFGILHEEQLAAGILPREGVEAFDRVLGDGLSRVIVTPRDLGVLIAERGADQARGALDRAATGAAAGVSPSHPRPALATPYVPPNTEAERRLIEIWQEILGIDRVGIHDNFFDLGGNSLTGLQVTARAEGVFSSRLDPVSLYNSPTVSALARLLAAEDVAEAPLLAERASRGERRRRKRRGLESAPEEVA